MADFEKVATGTCAGLRNGLRSEFALACGTTSARANRALAWGRGP